MTSSTSRATMLSTELSAAASQVPWGIAFGARRGGRRQWSGMQSVRGQSAKAGISAPTMCAPDNSAEAAIARGRNGVPCRRGRAEKP
jgi:hypothetical protein